MRQSLTDRHIIPGAEIQVFVLGHEEITGPRTRTKFGYGCPRNSEIDSVM